MSDNPICICGTHQSEHETGVPNPRSRTVDCPGFEADPKASDE